MPKERQNPFTTPETATTDAGEAAFMLDHAPSATENLAPDERRKLAEYRRKRDQRRAKARQRARGRANAHIELDLTTELKAQLEAIAEREGATVSSLATCLLYAALDLVDHGQLDLAPLKRPAQAGPRPYLYVHPRDQARQALIAKAGK